MEVHLVMMGCKKPKPIQIVNSFQLAICPLPLFGPKETWKSKLGLDTCDVMFGLNNGPHVTANKVKLEFLFKVDPKT